MSKITIVPDNNFELTDEYPGWGPCHPSRDPKRYLPVFRYKITDNEAINHFQFYGYRSHDELINQIQNLE